MYTKDYSWEKLWFSISEGGSRRQLKKEPPLKEGECSRYDSASVIELSNTPPLPQTKIIKWDFSNSY